MLILAALAAALTASLYILDIGPFREWKMRKPASKIPLTIRYQTERKSKGFGRRER